MLLLSLLNGFQYIFSLGHPSWKCCYFEVAWKTSYYLLQLFQDFKIVMYIFPSSIYYPVGFLFVCFFFPPPPVLPASLTYRSNVLHSSMPHF